MGKNYNDLNFRLHPCKEGVDTFMAGSYTESLNNKRAANFGIFRPIFKKTINIFYLLSHAGQNMSKALL